MSGTIAHPEGITNPPIDELLEVADSKYALVIYSAKRARQTTRRVCEGLGYDAGLVVWDPQVYGAEPDTLLEILGACPGTARRNT